MKTEIRRESNHSWLVVWEPEGFAGYAFRMIEENRIPGCLPTSCRNMDGSWQLCYEITGLSPLEELLKNRKLKAEELLAVLENLCHSLEGLEEYLLEAEHLLLEPEFIYSSQDLQHIFFCYVPAEGKPPGEAFQSLTEYFLPRLDHRDPKAVTLGYGIYRYAMETEFGTDSLRAVIRELLEKRQETSGQGKMSLEQEELWEQEEWDAEKSRREEAMRAFFEEDTEEEEDAVRKRAAAAAIIVLAVYLGICGWLWARRSIWIGLRGGIGILLALTGGITYFIWNRRQSKDSPEEGIQEKRREEEQFRQGPGRYGSRYGKEAENMSFSEPAACTVPENQEERETTLLSEIPGVGEGYCLKAIDPDFGQVLGFPDHSPFLIGKMQGTADVILLAPTVSRIHARICSRQGRWYLKDMNSRNGTYKNGERLVGEQETEIREGDELQFAERRYVFCREWTDIKR